MVVEFGARLFGLNWSNHETGGLAEVVFVIRIILFISSEVVVDSCCKKDGADLVPVFLTLLLSFLGRSRRFRISSGASLT